MTIPPMDIRPEHLRELRTAKRLLEQPSFSVKSIELLGRPIQKAARLLPAEWAQTIEQATHAALMRGLRFAVLSLGEKAPAAGSDRLHRLAVAASGALGGAAGLPALVVELPVTTVVMLRSIADVARANGEDAHCTATQLECLKVFALGGRSDDDEAMECSYLLIRASLARQTAQAAEYIARHGLVEGGPAIVRLIAAISSRFGLAVSEKAALQALPLLGALGGAAINSFFIGHFQDVARGHFTVRRLERLYGAEPIAQLYAAVEPLPA